jgi:hypothetical protein
VPDPAVAYKLPGHGKYFIAVRGPLDLASSLYYQGGDYAIVALHDDIQAPTQDDVDDQLAALLGALDQSLAQRCAVNGLLAPVCVIVTELLATLCGVVPILTPEGCAHLDGSLSGACWVAASTGREICPPLPLALPALPAPPCPPVMTAEGCAHLDGTLEGACWLAGSAAGQPVCPPVPALPELPPAPQGQPASPADAWLRAGLGRLA